MYDKVKRWDGIIDNEIPKASSVRMTEEIYMDIKVLQCLYSTPFGTPTFADIVRTLLRERVESIKEESKDNSEIQKDLEKVQQLLKEKLNLDLDLD